MGQPPDPLPPCSPHASPFGRRHTIRLRAFRTENVKTNGNNPCGVTRDVSDCETFSDTEEEMPEPETEDFFDEVVQNSLKAKKKAYLRKKE